MAKYRIVEKELIYTDYAKPDNPDKKKPVFKIQIRKFGKWCEPWEKSHDLWHLSDTFVSPLGRFDSYIAHVAVAQIVRALGCGPRGRGCNLRQPPFGLTR